MVCRKSYKDALIALVVITLIFLSNMITGYGILRYIFKLEDDGYVSRNHLILAGNLLNIFSMFGAAYMLLSGDIGVVISFIIFSSMLVFLIMNVYLSNYDATNKGADWTIILTLVLDTYVKLSAVLIGYGVCSIEQVPNALYGMGRTLVK